LTRLTSDDAETAGSNQDGSQSSVVSPRKMIKRLSHLLWMGVETHCYLFLPGDVFKEEITSKSLLDRDIRLHAIMMTTGAKSLPVSVLRTRLWYK